MTIPTAERKFLMAKVGNLLSGYKRKNPRIPAKAFYKSTAKLLLLQSITKVSKIFEFTKFF